MKERGDPLPESFESEEQAGAFWDCHSTMDYQEYLEATDDTIDISDCLSSMLLRKVKKPNGM